MQIFKNRSLQMHVLPFTIIFSLFFAFVINIPILMNICKILTSIHGSFIAYGSAAVSIFCILNLIFLLLSIRVIVKPLFIIILLISTVVSYASFYYGTIFNSEMLQNILQTHYSESTSYLNASFIIWLISFSIIPSILIYKVKIIHPSFLKETIQKLLAALITFVALLIAVVPCYKGYASVIRNNPQLQKMLIPTQWMFALGEFVKTSYFTKKVAYKVIGMDARNDAKSLDGKHNLLILVIGETARSKNYQYSGYDQPTNQHTKDQDVVYFNKVKSCGTSTAVSLPCMFSNLTRKQYSPTQAANQDNLLDILQRAKVNTIWLDNDAGCKGVCTHINTITIEPSDTSLCDGETCFDQILVKRLNDLIKMHTDQDTVIVLHLIGSHGPSYFKRYPQEHKFFIPDCPRSDIQNCDKKSLMNTYDNTILYTDYVINLTIELLKTRSSTWNTSLIYVSDHGESFGEKGLYLHGAPYLFAPKEQVDVPLLAWFSQSFMQNKQMDITCLKKHAKFHRYCHDNLFHSILGLMDIRTAAYDSKLDMFSPCRTDRV